MCYLYFIDIFQCRPLGWGPRGESKRCASVSSVVLFRSTVKPILVIPKAFPQGCACAWAFQWAKQAEVPAVRIFAVDWVALINWPEDSQVSRAKLRMSLIAGRVQTLTGRPWAVRGTPVRGTALCLQRKKRRLERAEGRGPRGCGTRGQGHTGISN